MWFYRKIIAWSAECNWKFCRISILNSYLRDELQSQSRSHIVNVFDFLWQVLITGSVGTIGSQLFPLPNQPRTSLTPSTPRSSHPNAPSLPLAANHMGLQKSYESLSRSSPIPRKASGQNGGENGHFAARLTKEADSLFYSHYSSIGNHNHMVWGLEETLWPRLNFSIVWTSDEFPYPLDTLILTCLIRIIWIRLEPPSTAPISQAPTIKIRREWCHRLIRYAR